MSAPAPVRVRPVRGHESFAQLRAAPARRGRAIRVRCLRRDVPEVRVAYQIGRHFGNAVQRNRARRRLRAAVDGFASQLAPADYLVIPQPAVLTMSFAELTETLRDCMTHSMAVSHDQQPRSIRP